MAAFGSGRIQLRGTGNSVHRSLGSSNGEVSLAVDRGHVSNLISHLLGLDIARAVGPLVTGEQITLMQIDNVVSAEAVKDKRTLQGIGIVPRPLDAVLPSYIWRFSPNGQFDRQTA